jgi:hypothetical protein
LRPPSQKLSKQKRTGDMAQALESLPRKHEALSSIANTVKKPKPNQNKTLIVKWSFAT